MRTTPSGMFAPCDKVYVLGAGCYGIIDDIFDDGTLDVRIDDMTVIHCPVCSVIRPPSSVPRIHSFSTEFGHA